MIIACLCAVGIMNVSMLHVHENMQGTTRTRSYKVEEVVVTGTRNETDIRHLPMTISVVGRQNWNILINLPCFLLWPNRFPGYSLRAGESWNRIVATGTRWICRLYWCSVGYTRLVVFKCGYADWLSFTCGHWVGSPRWAGFSSSRKCWNENDGK